MQEKYFSEFKPFSGFLQADGRTVPVTFRARINSSSGEVEFEFDEIALTKETYFIREYWRPEGEMVNYFSLSGKFEEGSAELTTETLCFSSLGSDHINPRGGCCSQVTFHHKFADAISKPWMRMSLKGFRSSHPLKSECRLGTIAMVEKSPSDVESDAITGFIIVKSDNEYVNSSVWQEEVNKLIDHVRRVMSFASGVRLQAPVVEFYTGDKSEIIVYSQLRQASSASNPVFSSGDQQSIFEAAVASFISPPSEVKNLFIALEWYVMDSTCSEVRLVNAMTVLENLISSNLDENDTLIRPSKEFENHRRTLRRVLKQCIDKWSIDETKKPEDILSDINERLADLNRRSLKQKLDILVERWSVPLDGIGEDKIKAAKKARDLIVHQGHYHKNDLWEHGTVIREIVVRFILTAIGYQGRYISYLGGYHFAQFPPKISGD
ncbi:MAG: hypothetical protein Q8Q50_11190 [Methylobacter sp.]|nr:hypothetical protein [Methylobacter sp.]